LKEIPADLPPGPFREALELANEATFSQDEQDAYDKVNDEIQQVRDLVEAKWANAKVDTLLRLLVRAGITFTDADRTRIQECTDTAMLDKWLDNVIGAKTITDVLG
jgi:hypothetical protein